MKGCLGCAVASARDGTLEGMHAQLLGMRLQHGLDGVEVGPLLGKGSFGSVYKGRWRGTLVAIKVLEAGLSEAGDDGSRESLLSASIAHPNVVQSHTPAFDVDQGPDCWPFVM